MVSSVTFKFNPFQVNFYKWCKLVVQFSKHSSLSPVRLFATPWTLWINLCADARGVLKVPYCDCPVVILSLYGC